MQNCSSKFKIDIKKRAYSYALELIKLIDELNQRDLSITVITPQLLRSENSIGANVGEVQASNSKRETVDALLIETEELSKILAPSILTLKGKRKS